MYKDEEKWKLISEFPDYQISSHGRIKRITSGGNNFCKVGKILKPHLEKNGYLRIGLYFKGNCYRRSIHRLVAFAFLGTPATSSHEVAHNDGSRDNNHFSNLRWCTRKENHADKLKHGTSQCGERNGNGKLDEKAVIDILTSGMKQVDLAKKYNVSKGTIWNIYHGRTWVHMQGYKPNA